MANKIFYVIKEFTLSLLAGIVYLLVFGYLLFMALGYTWFLADANFPLWLKIVLPIPILAALGYVMRDKISVNN